jgi:hypothetical protein
MASLVVLLLGQDMKFKLSVWYQLKFCFFLISTSELEALICLRSPWMRYSLVLLHHYFLDFLLLLMIQALTIWIHEVHNNYLRFRFVSLWYILVPVPCDQLITGKDQMQTQSYLVKLLTWRTSLIFGNIMLKKHFSTWIVLGCHSNWQIIRLYLIFVIWNELNS